MTNAKEMIKILFPQTGANANSIKAYLLVGLGFWLWKDLYRLADVSKAPEQVDKITEVINKYTDSYEHRRKHFARISHLI